MERVVLKDLLAPAISTRQAVEEIVKHLPKRPSRVIIDFEGVEFVSRSFAHEFSRFQEKNPNIEVENRSGNVIRMFEIVVEANVSKSRDEDITDSSINLPAFPAHLG